MRGRVRAVVAALAATVGLLVVPASAAANQGPDDDGPRTYVNMGDSFSAGAGILPLAPQREPRCVQSQLNWARVIAEGRALDLTDVSCSGADTDDYRTAQFATTPPQLAALSRETDLVTMTIGGNDSSVFSSAIQRCSQAASTTAGRGNPCEQRFGRSFENTITRSTYPALVRTLAAVRARAPQARVAISGYLRILPPEKGCYPIMPVAEGDVPYLNRVQTTLNDVVRLAAQRTGVQFLDVAGISLGRDACQLPGVRWVEPIVGSTNFVPVHPNALGERAMAENAVARLGPAAL